MVVHTQHPLGDVAPARARIEAWSAETDEDFRRVRNAAFEDAWGAVPMPPDMWRNKIVNQTFRPEVSFLLRDEAGTPAGLLVTHRGHRDPRRALHDRRDAARAPEARRRHRAAGPCVNTAAARGYDRASLVVDSASPSGASGVFEKAGFVPKTRYVRWALEA